MDIAVLGFVLVAMALIFISTTLTGASPMPTSPVVRDEMLAALPKEIDGPIYELGVEPSNSHTDQRFWVYLRVQGR